LPASFTGKQRYLSSVGAYLINQANEYPNIKLFYWREKNAEMDFVLTYGKKILGIEVKSNTEKYLP
jgi:predicted AAA+ superfamily ATPase